MKLEHFATMRGLELAHTRNGSALLEHVLNSEDGAQLREELKLRRVQFDTYPQLADEVERITSLLGCSKRQFMEMAVLDAIERAEARFQQAFADAAGCDISEA